jgi:hypothetical protein
MSYLAMSAQPINSDNIQHDQYDTPINKKRQSHTKTQKYRQASSDFDPQKVNSVLQSIHNNMNDDDDLGNYNFKGTAVSAKHSDNFKPMNPFEFPANPVSMGSERKENMSNMVPQPTDNEKLKLQELQSAYLNDAQVRDFYRRMVPNYGNASASASASTNATNRNNYYSNSATNSDNQVLIEKLNYMINLLEEQQDYKTGSVTEEVVLYTFLGVFIIFVIDSFTKVGKYKR